MMDDVRVVAFYLPQFHPIPENDRWWGPGFTEWTNVANARPLYPGHRQPRLPGELGFYDLRLPETRQAQAELARQYGVSAFLYWHYWFGGGRRLLERPFTEVVRTGEPDFPFCLAWANTDWSGVWHGAPDRLLMKQTYPGPDDHRAHFVSLLPAFCDERYLRVDGKPLFYVGVPDALPDAERFLELWRSWAVAAGLPGIYFVAGTGAGSPPIGASYDAFVTHWLPPLALAGRGLTGRAGRLLGVPTVRSYARQSRLGPPLRDDCRSFPCVLPGWDNTPRCGWRGLVLHGETPGEFQGQVERAVRTLAGNDPRERLLFVKSWNEWAEGNYLEPDRRHGRAFLEALRAGLSSTASRVELVGGTPNRARSSRPSR